MASISPRAPKRRQEGTPMKGPSTRRGRRRPPPPRRCPGPMPPSRPMGRRPPPPPLLLPPAPSLLRYGRPYRRSPVRPARSGPTVLRSGRPEMSASTGSSPGWASWRAAPWPSMWPSMRIFTKGSRRSLRPPAKSPPAKSPPAERRPAERPRGLRAPVTPPGRCPSPGPGRGRVDRLAAVRYAAGPCHALARCAGAACRRDDGHCDDDAHDHEGHDDHAAAFERDDEGSARVSRRRLDAELVRRGLARSREQAARLIEQGLVQVHGQTAGKAASQVDTGAPIVVSEPAEGPEYVSRGGHKLAGALQAFPGADPAGRRCLDAGASTGGFTDVLLRAGAAHVVAVDVGYGQIAWSLRTDDRVTVVERVNIRDLVPEQVGEPPSMVVADLSFISLRLVLAPIQRCVRPDADYLMMVKPQFEVGRERVGAGGVVRDPALRAEAVLDVAAYAQTIGLGVEGVTASPLPGPSGNVEYFLWLRGG